MPVKLERVVPGSLTILRDSKVRETIRTKASDGTVSTSQTGLLTTRCVSDRSLGGPGGFTTVQGRKWQRATNYLLYGSNIQSTPGTWRTSNATYSDITITGEYGVTNELDGVFHYGNVGWDANMAARTEVECMLKLNDNKVQLAQYLAESVKTGDMIATRAADLFGALLSVKKAAANGLKGWLKSSLSYSVKHPGKRLPQGYLEFQYGWLPLAKDLYALKDVYNKGLDIPGHFVRATRTVKEGRSNRKASSSNYFKDCTDNGHGTFGTEIVAAIDDASLQKLKMLGLVDPLALGWELVPYSFVVDWAMPIGNVLAARSAQAGLTFVGGRTFQLIEGNFDGKRKGPVGYDEVASQVVTAQYMRFERKRLNGFPLARPYVKSPFSTQHAANALALFMSLRK